MSRTFRSFRLQPPLAARTASSLRFADRLNHERDITPAHHTFVTRVTHRFRLLPAGSPRRQAESSSLSFRTDRRLPVLPTPPHGDAVPSGYRIKLQPPDRDLHPVDSVHLQTHWHATPSREAARRSENLVCADPRRATACRRSVQIPDHSFQIDKHGESYETPHAGSRDGVACHSQASHGVITLPPTSVRR